MVSSTVLGASFVAVVVTTAAFEWVWHGLYQPPLLRKATFQEQVVCYALVLLTLSGLVGYDSFTTGPVPALKHGITASIIIWFLLLPFGKIAVTLITPLWVVCCCAIGIYVTHFACTKLSHPWASIAGVVICGTFGLFAMYGSQFRVVQLVVGTILLPLVVYVSVWITLNYLPDAIATYTPIITVPPVSSLNGVVELEKDTQLYRDLADEFELQCAQFAHKYNFWLQIESIHRVVQKVVNSKGKKKNNNASLVRTADGRRLFHGTKRDNAQGIINNGFRLPSHNGMFGKGIYFADCPLKSWGYTDTRHRGTIFACWVELGRQSHQKAAKNSLTRPPRRSFTQWLKREKKYASVVGDEEEVGGALRLPEFIIYDPANAEVEYLFEVTKVEQGIATGTK